MAGLVPAIHVFLVDTMEDVDARHKAGHDDFWVQLYSSTNVTVSATPARDVR
jgi:hypothetical protein